MKSVANPLCVDSKCIATGYATTNMKNTTCPTVIDCSVKATLENSGISIGQSIPIRQNCGDSGTTETTETGVLSSLANQFQDGLTNLFGDSKMTIVLIFILIVIIAIFTFTVDDSIFDRYQYSRQTDRKKSIYK
jgi:hypothetical protein